MKTVFLVLVDEDGSFVAVCKTEEAAKNRAVKYQLDHGNYCEVFEEELED